MVLGRLTQLSHIIDRRLDKRVELQLQIADVAGDQREPAGTLGRELDSGEAGDQ